MRAATQWQPTHTPRCTPYPPPTSKGAPGLSSSCRLHMCMVDLNPLSVKERFTVKHMTRCFGLSLWKAWKEGGVRIGMLP